MQKGLEEMGNQAKGQRKTEAKGERKKYSKEKIGEKNCHRP